MVCTKFNSHVYKLLGNDIISILQLGVWKRCFHWGVLNVPKKNVDGPMNYDSFKQKKEKVMSAPMN
jgi:hypothetical protein